MASHISRDNCQVLMTAAEAYPAFERAVLNAQKSVIAGFRVFDLTTKLHEPECQKLGNTWFDLVLYKLDQGVRVQITISDFDPIVRHKLHADTWETIRIAQSLIELTRNPELLSVSANLHGARIGGISNLALWAKSRDRIAKICEEFNNLPAGEKTLFRAHRPLLEDLIDYHNPVQAKPVYWPKMQLVPASHHHKMAVIDDSVLYIGGLDLNDRRFDTKYHDRASDETWHDVQILIDDVDLAKTARMHLDDFGPVTSGEIKPSSLPLPFLRTISIPQEANPLSLSPQVCQRDLRSALLRNITSAERFIYLETQFFRDADIAMALCSAAEKNINLNLVLILPAAPEDVAFEHATDADARFGEYLQAQCIDQVIASFGDRCFIGAPVRKVNAKLDNRSSTHGAPLIYLHAKVSIFDDTAAIISSANLNGRSLNWDTEAGVELSDTNLVSHVFERCVDHWMGGDERSGNMPTETAISWFELAQTNAAKAPVDRDGFIVPYDPEPGRAFGRNLPGVPREMV